VGRLFGTIPKVTGDGLANGCRSAMHGLLRLRHATHSALLCCALYLHCTAGTASQLLCHRPRPPKVLNVGVLTGAVPSQPPAKHILRCAVTAASPFDQVLLSGPERGPADRSAVPHPGTGLAAGGRRHPSKWEHSYAKQIGQIAG